jgi:hypothetical protein
VIIRRWSAYARIADTILVGDLTIAGMMWACFFARQDLQPGLRC